MRYAASLLLVDLPVLAAVAVVGWINGYQNTFTAVMDYRTQHLWTYLPSLLLAVVLVRRWRKT